MALPLKSQSAVAFGNIVGEYEFRKDVESTRHIRKTEWIKTIPRSSIDHDILYSLGAFMTVCQVERNDAENRVRTLRERGVMPIVDLTREEGGEAIDIEQYARDQIIKYVGKKFSGHDLARLVDAVLQAQGYITEKSPPGPDKGVDILAARGTFGFDRPRMCVQVKSSSAPLDVKVPRELQGVTKTRGAEQGLLVSWGDSAIRRSRNRGIHFSQ